MTFAETHEAYIELGEFWLDPIDERLWSSSGPVRLGNKAFLVLSHLVNARGQLVTKDALFSSVWDGTIVSEGALTSVVKELRRALGDDSKHPRYIQSVYGRGYRLLEPVSEYKEAQRFSQSHLDQASSAATAAPGPPSYPPLLYVSAFSDNGLDSSNPWLSEVLREELLLALSRFRDFRLVSDPPVEGASSGTRSFGERDYELTIRLFDNGSAISAFARIVRLESQEIIWGEREQLDPHALGDDIKRLISKIVAAALPKVDDDVTRRLPVRTNDAFGMYLLNKMAMRAADDLIQMQAVACKWEEFLERQPDFAQAYAPLIYLYNTDYGYTGLGTTTDVERGRAHALARKAIRLDPSEPYLHTVSAWCHLWASEAIAAGEHLNQAVELNPFHRDRLLEVATAWMFIGNLDLASKLLRRCESLSPFAIEAPLEEAALLHLLLGEYDKALACLQRISLPTISSEFYGLLAAGASGAPDFAERVSLWSEHVRRRWQCATAPDPAALSRWALYHHPFQEPSRRQWVLEILEPALTGGPAATSRIPERAPTVGLSEPFVEEGRG